MEVAKIKEIHKKNELNINVKLILIDLKFGQWSIFFYRRIVDFSLIFWTVCDMSDDLFINKW